MLKSSKRIQDYRIICVNDGSSDGTKELLDELSHAFSHLEVIHLKRNQGPAQATLAGMARVAELAREEDIAVRMDADYEHDPQDIPRLLSVMGGPTVQMCFAYLTPTIRRGLAFYLLHQFIGGYENQKPR